MHLSRYDPEEKYISQRILLHSTSIGYIWRASHLTTKQNYKYSIQLNKLYIICLFVIIFIFFNHQIILINLIGFQFCVHVMRRTVNSTHIAQQVFYSFNSLLFLLLIFSFSFLFVKWYSLDLEYMCAFYRKIKYSLYIYIKL